MKESNPTRPRRIIIIDDNPSIHDDIRKILKPGGAASAALAETKALLFDEDNTAPVIGEFEIDSAMQGDEGIRMVDAAAAEGLSYSLAFVDVRMPPGIDGIETVTRIWKSHPELQIVICTAYSDYSWEAMVGRLGRSSSMVVLKKPFDNIEVLQLAHALTEKWRLSREVQSRIRDLDARVEQRTAELRQANEQLRREIAERLQVEKALVLSEERFSKAFNANPIPLAIQSLEAESITDSNQGFQTLTGYTSNDLTGRTPRELNLWVEPEQTHTLLETLKTERSIRNSPCQLRTKGGRVRDILLSVEIIELSGRSFLLTILQDITEQLLLEQQLRHSQKMEAVGQLAAGIAHDFNNMLTVIQGNTSLLLSDEPDKSRQPMLESILRSAQRSAKLVRQLLAFSHKQMMEIRPVNIGGLLGSFSEMLPPVLGERIAIGLEVAPGLPPVAADPAMIEQLLVNLAINARDAMPQGGNLNVTAGSVDVTAATVRGNQDARPGRYLRICVNDDGEGIPPEVLSRIFEPFFTTKPVGKGTGLGLATAYGIARQHGGWMEVRSTPGKGTTFSIFIPFIDGPVPRPSEGATAGLRTTRGTETILAVEDEDAVRTCVRAILKAQGYRVIPAANGIEALTVWKIHRGEIQLLLTDMVMPEGLTGMDLAARLLADEPALRVIYTSGYSDGFASTQTRFPEGHRFLAKPYPSKLLVETVREALDSPRSIAPETTPVPG